MNALLPLLGSLRATLDKRQPALRAREFGLQLRDAECSQFFVAVGNPGSLAHASQLPGRGLVDKRT